MESPLSLAAQHITDGPIVGQLWQSATDASLAMTDSPPIHDDSYPTGDDTAPHTGATPLPVTERHAVLRSERIGRFVVLRELGAGGMGVVYSAFDEALGRRVAVKLLFASRATDNNARRRLEREAQALARLSHPNVVQVHEVGEHAGDVFVAMEFVKGATLEAWAKAEPRSWREVVACYLQAARGLQAAHDAGVLHRDFKPANAILGDDGRVRVLDFGLARTSEQPEPLPDDTGRGSMSASVSGQDERLTVTGSVLGTPAYMAPEQFLGDPVDARTDVFCFCVSLYEALYKERPFQGKTRYALLQSVLAGPGKFPERGLPARIEQLLRRGLAREPDRRPQSMQEVVAILDFDPLRKRRWWLMGGTMALVATGAGLGGSMLSEATPPPPCQGFEQELRGVWDDERKAEIEAAFERSGSDLSEAVWPRVAGLLDERAEVLVSGMQTACEATRVTGKQSEARLDRRMTCLDDRKRSMRALTEVLGRADRLTVAHAEDAVQGLPSSDMCADPQWLDASLEPPRDEAQQQQVAQVRERLATGQATLNTGHFLEAAPIAEQAWSEAEEIDYGPLLAEAGYLRSKVDTELGRYRSARATILDVVDQAEASHHDQLVANAWLWLVYLDAQRLGDETHVDVWIRRAAAAGRRVGEPVEQRIELLSQQALWAIDQGDADAAQRYIDEATQLQDEARPGSHLMNLENARAELAWLRGKHDVIVAIRRDKLQRHLADDPAGHPRIALARQDLGVALLGMGELAVARRQFEQALGLLKKTYGSQPHLGVGGIEMNLGGVALHSRDFAAAKDYMERAFATIEASVGTAHPKAAMALHNLGVVAFTQGELRASATYTQRALEIYAQSYGEDHINWGETAINLGEMLLYLGEHEQARSLIKRGASVIRAIYAEQHAGRALSLKLEGLVLLLDGRPAKAESPLSRALDLCVRSEAQERADITIALAIATWHRDPARAREIAQSHEAKLDDEVGRERRLSLVQLLARYETAINVLGLDS
ncbi:MAG: serine/threonine-protein kinase [Myxococcota bacterium]